MPPIEAYSFLFFDSLMSTLILPPHEELVYGTMKSFGGYNMALAWLLAVLGSSCGMLANYGLGRLILLCEKQELIPKRSRHLEEAAANFRRYGIYLLPFAFIPVFGTAATVAAGLSRTNLWLFLGLVILGRGGVYLYHLLV